MKNNAAATSTSQSLSGGEICLTQVTRVYKTSHVLPQKDTFIYERKD